MSRPTFDARGIAPYQLWRATASGTSCTAETFLRGCNLKVWGSTAHGEVTTKHSSDIASQPLCKGTLISTRSTETVGDDSELLHLLGKAQQRAVLWPFLWLGAACSAPVLASGANLKQAAIHTLSIGLDRLLR
jgi:hypothetical protein